MPGPVSRTENRTAPSWARSPATVMVPPQVCAKRVADEIGQRTLQLCWNASDLPSARKLFGWRKFQHAGAPWLCVSNATAHAPRPRSAASAPARRPFSHARQRLPSSRDSVSKSRTTLCMREACCDIMPR